MNSKNYYKYCIVPECKNTSKKTPEKLFIYVPNNEEVRKKWLTLARRSDAHTLSMDTRMYFCEDHFDLPNDMVNYMQYHVMKTISQVRMKPGCIPTRFACQEDRKKRTCNTDRPYILKKQRMITVAECLKESEESNKRISGTETSTNSIAENVQKSSSKQTANKSVQVLLRHKFRSKAVQTKDTAAYNPTDCDTDTTVTVEFERMSNSSIKNEQAIVTVKCEPVDMYYSEASEMESEIQDTHILPDVSCGTTANSKTQACVQMEITPKIEHEAEQHMEEVHSNGKLKETEHNLEHKAACCNPTSVQTSDLRPVDSPSYMLAQKLKDITDVAERRLKKIKKLAIKNKRLVKENQKLYSILIHHYKDKSVKKIKETK